MCDCVGLFVCFSSHGPEVVLTRERGKNDKVKLLLEEKGVHCLEIPMVETKEGPDFDQLPTLLMTQRFDWVCITSPEAASVFIEGWKKAGKPQVRIAVVGKGTGRVLEATQEPILEPKFTPSVANAEHFGPELPTIPGGNNTVLYPSSAKASTLLQEGLEQRNFRVLRLNTYNTVTVKHVEADTLEQARKAKVVAIASPSALKAWVEHMGQPVTSQMTIAAIGSTSARAAEKLGLDRILYPEKPGVDTFVETIIDALQYDTI
jgi:uroporphyrinogen-III synthase